MLYFTETQDHQPEMYEVNEQFEREYDATSYEKKISDLFRHLYERDKKESPEAARRDEKAISDLRSEDHYLLVMIDQALEPRGDFWTVAACSTAIIVLLIGALAGVDALNSRHLIPLWITNVPLFVWVFCIAVVAAVVPLVIKLARAEALGDVVRATLTGVFGFPRKRKD